MIYVNNFKLEFDLTFIKIKNTFIPKEEKGKIEMEKLNKIEIIENKKNISLIKDYQNKE